MKNLFTPRISVTSERRINIYLSDSDYKKIKRGKEWEASVTDLTTGIDYEVKGLACCLPTCFCDAVIIN